MKDKRSVDSVTIVTYLARTQILAVLPHSPARETHSMMQDTSLEN